MHKMLQTTNKEMWVNVKVCKTQILAGREGLVSIFFSYWSHIFLTYVMQYETEFIIMS
jgi:hypothetical protein